MSGGSFLGGIHTAAAGGVWLIIVKGFAGFELTDTGVAFKPALPQAWEGLKFKLCIRGCLLEVALYREGIRIYSQADNPAKLHVQVPGKEAWLEPGDSLEG